MSKGDPRPEFPILQILGLIFAVISFAGLAIVRAG